MIFYIIITSHVTKKYKLGISEYYMETLIGIIKISACMKRNYTYNDNKLCNEVYMKKSFVILVLFIVVLLSSCPEYFDNTKSSDATLNMLNISHGELSPEFSSTIHNYSVSVDSSVETISLDPTATDSNATIIYNLTMPVTLLEDTTTIEVNVVAEDGITENTYSIVVNRESAPVKPSVIPSIGTTSSISRSFTPDWNDYEYDIYVPAITGFKNNVNNLSVNDQFSVNWGNLVLDFFISEDDGVFTYLAELEDSYIFTIKHNTNSGTFEYRHELNIFASGPDSISDNDSDIVAICVIPESILNEDYSFNTTSSLVAYAVNGSNTPSPGVFYYFDQVAIYRGEMEVNNRLELSTSKSGYGFAFHKLYYGLADSELDLSLSDSTINVLEEILNETNNLKNSGGSMNGSCLGVTLDDGSKFWEHNLSFDENDVPVWMNAFTDLGVYVGTNNGTSGSNISLAQFKTFIPWSTSLVE